MASASSIRSIAASCLLKKGVTVVDLGSPSQLQLRSQKIEPRLNAGLVNIPSKRRYVRVVVSATAASVASPNAVQEPEIINLVKESDKYFAQDSSPIILFDGVCNFCNAGVNFVLDHDPKGKVRFAALQTPAGRALLARSGRSPDDISSIVLVEQEGAYVKSEAVLRIAQLLDIPGGPLLGALGLLTPAILRDALYEVVAEHRKLILGEANSCRFSQDGSEARFLA